MEAVVCRRLRYDVVLKLAELRGVAWQRVRRIAQLHDDITGAPPVAVAKLRDRGANDRRQVDRRSRAAEAVGFDARDGEEVDDELLHPPRLTLDDRQETAARFDVGLAVHILQCLDIAEDRGERRS